MVSAQPPAGTNRSEIPTQADEIVNRLVLQRAWHLDALGLHKQKEKKGKKEEK
jgi:hypothetical protein